MSKEQFDELLKDYRSIWNNRLLETEGSSSEETIIKAIKRELLDENSHPRIRKNKYEKYFSAIKRVMGSSVPPETKLQLINIHNKIMEELSKE